MTNLFSKAKPWVVASMLAATSLFSQETTAAAKCKPSRCDQGDMASAMMPGYNATSRIDVRGAWDFFITGNFLYLQPSEDNIQLGLAQTTNILTGVPVSGALINMQFDYKPGFQVGLGMNFEHDGWDAFAEYTWLHCTNSASVTMNTNNAFTSYWIPVVDQNAAVEILSASSASWRTDFDVADLSLGRCYYVGQKLTFHPFFGGRAAWIRQYYNVTNTAAINGFQSNSYNTSKSWGLGLRTGLDTNWIIGYGFRLFGCGSADILFTRYTTISSLWQNPNTDVEDTNITTADTDCLRPHADLEFGFGWGTYFDNNNWHIDFTAGYGFQVFWDQNMFYRGLDDIATAQVFYRGGNLYLQGMNLGMRLDF